MSRADCSAIGIAARAFRIDVDQAHLDRRERVFERHLLLGLDAGLVAFLADPLLLGAPVDVLLGLPDVGAAAAEAEHRAAHRFDRDVAGQDHQVGPAEACAVLLLDRPEQAARLVEIAVVRPGVERREALLTRDGAAAAVAGAIGAGAVPGHADEERAVMAIIGRPPGLAVGHQRGQVALHRRVVERLERLGIVEVVAHRVADRPFWWRMSSDSWLGHQSRLVRPSSVRSAAGSFAGLLSGSPPVFTSMMRAPLLRNLRG